MKRINSYDELKATVEKYKPLLDLRKKMVSMLFLKKEKY